MRNFATNLKANQLLYFRYETKTTKKLKRCSQDY